MSIALNLFHESAYSEDGIGYVFLELFGAILDSLSECVMIILVLKLANGWYSTYYKYD
jgi:hypothetical protein